MQMHSRKALVNGLPPHDLAAEEAVLGSILLDDSALGLVEAIIGPQDFYSPAHRRIFEAMASLAAEGEAIDLVTLAARCKERGVLEAVGGPGALVELLEKTPSAARAVPYARIVADRAARRREIAAAAEVARLAHDPTATEAERAAARASLAEAGAGRASPDGEPVLVRLADVAPAPLEWLWPARVPLGKLTLLVGDPGRGKSLLALDVAARVTRGRPWPDAPEAPAPLGNVVLLSAEDDLADTIRPRLDAAGADPQRVVELRAVRRPGAPEGRGFCLGTDLAALERAIERTGEVRLVVLDPLSAYLGGTDSHKNAEVRALLAPLQELAARSGAAVLAVTHLNKNAATSAIYRPSGSLAFVAAARAVWAVVPDNDRPDRRLLLPVKCNLAGPTGGMAYAVVEPPDHPGTPIVAWEPEPVLLTAAEALGGPQPQGNGGRRYVSEWLRELLADGPVRSREVEQAAREAGIGKSALQRAKRALGVVACPRGFGSPWTWRLPSDEPTLWPDADEPAAPKSRPVSPVSTPPGDW